MPTILIADDDTHIRNLFQRALEVISGPGCIFETCNSGPEAVNRVLQGGIDLVLMDIRMPPHRMSGIDAVKRIREFSDLPIVMVSAYGDKNSREAAQAAGVTRFVVKPPDYQLLAILIKKLTATPQSAPGQAERLEKGRRLELLKITQAKRGDDTPPHILTEIEDLEMELAEWRKNTPGN